MNSSAFAWGLVDPACPPYVNARMDRTPRQSESNASHSSRFDTDATTRGMVQPFVEVATEADRDVLVALIDQSARALCATDYSSAQIESALGSVWGLDTQLIRDRTYFIVRAGSEVVGCGGWSWRRTLFGADAYSDRNSGELQPGRDSARIRAFFVSPAWVRRGLGRRILERCEAEAVRCGFSSAELMATLPGVKLYQACGYVPGAAQSFPLPNGMSIDFVPMVKQLVDGDGLSR